MADVTAVLQPTVYAELEGLGVWFRRRQYRSYSMRQVLSGRAWRDRSRVTWALRHVDLVCHEGQVLGIVGPNGAGKSTLCLVLAGILSPDEGRAAVRGQVSALLSLGAGLQKDLTGRENIVLNAAFLGMGRRELRRRIDGIIDFAELRDAIDEPVRTYSSGMRARLGFSVAASLEPEVLILDEVLAVGDISFRARSQRRIEEMIARSKLIIIVSHEVELLRDLCTHCLWLDEGRIVAHGDAGPVLDEFVRAMAPTAGPR